MYQLNRKSFYCGPSPATIRKRLIKAKALKKSFSTSVIRLGVNPQDGTELDSTREIVDACENSQEVEEYFDTKKTSINESYRADSNSAAASGVSASELNAWLQDKNELLQALACQKDDVYDVGNFPDILGSTTGGVNNTGSNLNPGNNSNSGLNNGTNNFTQDSSGIVPTEFDSSDYYDDF